MTCPRPPFLLPFLFLAFLGPALTFSQSRIGIFLDCQMRCDRDYLKQELQFVNWMFNRQEADLYILATDQDTGAGGELVQLVMIGEKSLAGMRDTTTFLVDPNATDAMEREQLLRELKRALLPFLLATDWGSAINYEVDLSTEAAADRDSVIRDPWNYWVFNVGGNASFDGEAQFRNLELRARISAVRVTDEHKLELFTFYNYEQGTFTLTTGETFTSLIRSYRFRGLYVRSLSPHWSVGARATVGSSTFSNTDLDAAIKPAVEYNLFPYTEAQTRRFTIRYALGPEYYDFTDSTIYGKLEQTLVKHELDLEFTQTQQWGNVSVRLGAEQFLHSPRLYSAFFNPNVEWQILTGLSLDVGGFFSLVRDRINISQEDLSDEDILLQIRQLDTSFSYFSYFGINYRFGSNYNNFVNPRF